MGLFGNPDSLDMENRDPNNLNGNLGVQFEDIIGEPEGAHSHECVWRWSYKCYNCGLSLCYMILTFLCAVPSALCWGCSFACVAFSHIWEVTPYLKLIEINCSCTQKFITILLNCILKPVCETCGLFFSRIEVQNK